MFNLAEALCDGDAFREAVQQAQPYRPLHVKIKLTWNCNLRCVMCNVWRQSREDHLTLKRVRALATELHALGTQKIHLSGGEVLMREDIEDVIDAFASRGMQVNLTTNATLLTPEKAQSLIESGIHNVSVSVEGSTPAIHDTLRGKGNWKRTLRGIRNLRRAAKHAHRKLHIRINSVITRHNYRDLANLPETLFQAGADRLTLIPVDDKQGSLRLNKARIHIYNNEVAPYLAHQALRRHMIQHVEQAYPFGRSKEAIEVAKMGEYALGLYTRQPCYMPWVHAMIDPKGKVYPCCMLRSREPLGNFIKAGGFQKVWQGENYTNFRRQMLASDHAPALCRGCDDFLAENQFMHALVTDQQEQRNA